MKKMLKKLGTVNSIGLGLDILGLLIALVAAFLGHFANVQIVMQIIASMMILVGLFMSALVAKEHRLVKVIGSVGLAIIIISWILPYGSFTSGTYQAEADLGRIGLAEIGNGLYYAFNFTMDKILFLFILAGFYGVLSHIGAYQQLVSNIAKKLQGKEIVTALVMTLLITAFTTLATETFAVLVFIPFFVSILAKMKVDKLSTFAITYGSLLVGILGVLYGSRSLIDFNYYIGSEATTGLLYRGIILAVAYVLYNFFIVMRLRSVKKTKNLEATEDLFAVDTTSTKKKSNPIALIIILYVMLVIVVLGYISWSGNWNIKVFDDFHQAITEFTVKDAYSWLLNGATKATATFGQNTTILSYIIGKTATALGTFEYLYVLDGILIITSILLALIYRMKANDYIKAFGESLGKAVKPIAAAVGVYFVFFLIYMSPFITSISNWLFGLTKGLNPFLASIAAFISSIFSPDLGYIAYSVGQYLTNAYAANFEIVHTIYTSMYGLVQVIAPTSLLLMVGLAMSNLDYKTWFKYIWLFVVGMFIILLVLFAVLLYV